VKIKRTITSETENGKRQSVVWAIGWRCFYFKKARQRHERWRGFIMVGM